MIAQTNTPTNPIRALRSLCPDRQLTDSEARSVAERQASRLLALFEIDSPGCDETFIIQLPRILVRSVSGLPTSGATRWSGGRWLIELNAEDHELRRRFSLAHELKHIIDHPYIDRIYPAGGSTSNERAETICDYFAACLLMPRPWVKRAFGAGIQKPAHLATLFGVSRQAMQFRLDQLGLSEPIARCGRSPRSRRLYARSLPSELSSGVIG